MGQVTLDDISLSDYTLQNTGELEKLKKSFVAEPVQICIERAKFITEYMKANEAKAVSPELLRAGAIKNYLSNKKAVFPDTNLLAGTTGSKLKSAPVYPEFIGLTIWSELETISKRPKNSQLLTRDEAAALNYEIYPYWIDRDVLSTTKHTYGETTGTRLLEKIIFYIASKAGCISHTVPSFERVLAQGMKAIAQEAAQKQKAAATDDERHFFEAVQIVLSGAMDYAANLSREAGALAEKEKNPARKKQLEAMARVCAQVPAGPAQTFYEAVNAIWLCLIAIHAENCNMAISPGRLDQVLYPYYKKDIAEGNLTVQRALELVGCLWLKLGDNVDLVPQVSEELFGGAGTAPAVTLGGIDANGEDAVNDLTYIMLRATELLKTREPNLNARYHYLKNTQEYRDRVCEVIAGTKAVPAFHNDVANINTLKEQNVLEPHANDYAIIGCVELAVPGRSYDASSSIIMNLVGPLEMALYNGKRYVTGDEDFGAPKTGDPTSFKTFDQFLDAYKRQAQWVIEQAIGLNEQMGHVHQNMLPTPLLSSFYEGPFQQSKDLIFGGALYNSSGATHVGFADTVDSLNAVRYAVFEENICTMKELIDAVRSDFKGKEPLRQFLANKVPRYGTDAESEKNCISQDIVAFLYNLYHSHPNYRGGKYRPAYWTMTNHAGQGKITYALPNGRHAYLPFSSGITPVSGAKANLTECLNNVAALNHLNIPGGEALNIKFTQIASADDVRRLGDFITAYFKNGGQQVQFNIMSYQMLKDAKAHPEKYTDLLVRVSGYSAYFNDLSDIMKDELITRTEYNIENGEAVPFQ